MVVLYHNVEPSERVNMPFISPFFTAFSNSNLPFADRVSTFTNNTNRYTERFSVFPLPTQCATANNLYQLFPICYPPGLSGLPVYSLLHCCFSHAILIVQSLTSKGEHICFVSATSQKSRRSPVAC